MAAVPRACFRADQRLTTASDFQQVFQAPDHKAGQGEVLLLARHSDRPSHRLGLAIAKKHIPTAVKRNSLKRLARETFRHLDQKTPTLDIVVLSRPGAGKADKDQLRKALARQFARLQTRARRL